MKIETANAIYLALAFIAPGFVLDWGLSLFTPRRESIAEVSWVRFLTLSSLNYATWSWLILILINSTSFQEHLYYASVVWLFVIFLGPIFLAWVMGHAIQKEWAYRLLQLLGYRPVHMIPTSWDYKFSGVVGGNWILVTLINDSQIAGLFGPSSFASSDSAERDLYIEQVLEIQENGDWLKKTADKGILLKGSEIRCIEFWPLQGDQGHG